MRHVVAVAAYNPQGLFLMGQRLDTGRWTTPAGHVEAGEDYGVAAVRELWEEAGLTPLSLEYLGSEAMPGRNLTVHCYRAQVPGDVMPHGGNDPDEECEIWQWFEPDHLPSPLQTSDNALLRLCGHHATVGVEDQDGGFAQMMAESHRGR